MKLDAKHENKEYRTLQRSENAAKANTVATKVLNQISYGRTDKKCIS